LSQHILDVLELPPYNHPKHSRPHTKRRRPAHTLPLDRSLAYSPDVSRPALLACSLIVALACGEIKPEERSGAPVETPVLETNTPPPGEHPAVTDERPWIEDDWPAAKAKALARSATASGSSPSRGPLAARLGYDRELLATVSERLSG